MSTTDKNLVHQEGDMNRDQPPIQYKPRLGYDDGPYQPGLCWQCRCIECCCGGLLGSPLPFAMRCVDCILTYRSYKVGAYIGGNFNREKRERTERRVEADPTGNSGMIVIDLTVPSVYEPGVSIPVRIFKQVKRQRNPRKVVYYIHGGGWCIGHPQSLYYHNSIARIATSGAIVVAVDYRLAPEHPFPAAVHDVFDCLRWIASKPTLGVFSDADMSNVILSGDSAGGNMSMVLSTLIRDGLDADLKPLDLGIKIEKQILIYPAFLLDRFLDKPGPSDLPFHRGPVMEFYLQSYVPGATRKDKLMLVDSERRLCPLVAGFHKLPKTIIFSGAVDALLPQIEFAVDVMKKTGSTDVSFHVYEGIPHAFFLFGGLNATHEALKVITAEIQST